MEVKREQAPAYPGVVAYQALEDPLLAPAGVVQAIVGSRGAAFVAVLFVVAVVFEAAPVVEAAQSLVEQVLEED